MCNIINVILIITIVQEIKSDWWNPECFYTKDICPNENVTFWLYTQENRDNPIQLKEENLDHKLFTTKKPLKIIIHGFTGHKDYEPNKSLRPAFLDAMDVYIVSVDYNPIVREPCYFHSVRNYLTAAKCTANFIDKLVDEKIIPLNDIHVIGFSLGAQVAGALSEFLKCGKLKRISGLDPARPLFEFADLKQRLDKSDAEFVDVIHTDIGVRGFVSQVGHIDFYPNGGEKQPGCQGSELTEGGSCNHDRAPNYYAESISSTVGFWGYECPSLFQYRIGLCRWSESKQQEIMGYHANPKARGMYFLETNSAPPFARGLYKK